VELSAGAKRFQEPTRQVPLAVWSAGADQQLMGDDGTENDPRQLGAMKAPERSSETGIVEGGDVDVGVEQEHGSLGGGPESVHKAASAHEDVEARLYFGLESSHLRDRLESPGDRFGLGGGTQELLGAVDLLLIEDQVLALQVRRFGEGAHEGLLLSV